ncbi:MAG: MnhB domain-containing protein [Caldilineaceae bacterium]|nr:MnhB domain-containing protein [Caldilineaceae bacterium]
MTELYLRLVDRVLTPILLLLAFFLLVRGHDLPGGGFIAALMAAIAFYLQILARGSAQVRRELGRFLQPGIGVGLLLAVGSAWMGLAYGGFFKAGWGPELHFGTFHLKLSTPLIFDLGVFITVICFAISYLLGLSETVAEPELPGGAAWLSRSQDRDSRGEEHSA